MDRQLISKFIKVFLLTTFLMTTFKPLNDRILKTVFIVLSFLIVISMFFDLTMTIILLSLMIIILIKHYQSIHIINTTALQSKEKYENIQVSNKPQLDQYKVYDLSDLFEDPINNHIKSIEKKLVQTQTNIFDPINYNLFFNNLKKKQYNTQGFSSDNENVIGFDKSIYTFS